MLNQLGNRSLCPTAHTINFHNFGFGGVGEGGDGWGVIAVLTFTGSLVQKAG